MGTLITLTLVLAAAGAVSGVWHYFAKSLENVMSKAAEKIKEFVHIVLAGAKCLLKKIADAIKEIVKVYTYDRDRDTWIITTTEREIPPDEVENEVPADIRANIENDISREHDVTDKVELKLKECA